MPPLAPVTTNTGVGAVTAPSFDQHSYT